MSDQKPNHGQHDPATPPPRPGATPPQPAPSMNAYQVVTDTVTGVNVRGSDNLIQLLVVVVTTIIGIIVGAIVNHESLMLIGLFGFGGLVIGVLFSGAVIGIYRMVKIGK